ncbi:3-oxoadipate enol-lactonase [Paraburkholderia sp. GAS333]|uniref:alpha/beta fold hydrolase n=1 Tax=Paraburkholderia sp. GAS333 TaxID=3156279 RepID=UPI003D1D6D3E
MSSLATPTVSPGTPESAWRQSGTGVAGTVLMLHSLGLDARAFDGIRAALPDDWHIVSFDQRGHGKAAATAARSLDELVDDACQVIDSCTARQVHLVGHSMGGAVAALCAARLGPRVASLALIATPAAGFPAFNARAQVAIEEGMQTAIPATLERWFGAEPVQSEAGAIAYAQDALSEMAPTGFAAAWRALANFEGYQPIGQKLPRTRLIAGVRDLSTPPSSMRSIFNTLIAAGAQPTPVFDEIDDAGHMLVLTHAPAVAASLQTHWLSAVRQL